MNKTLTLISSLILIIAGSLYSSSALGLRNAPITVVASFNTCPGDSMTIPVTVTNFSLVTAITLRIEYDSTVIKFGRATPNAILNGMIVNTVPLGTGSTFKKILIVWSDINPKSLSNGSAIVTFRFKYLGGSTALAFNNTSSGGADCEYADEVGNPMIDIPTASFYTNGSYSNAAPGAAGAITGSSIVCKGASGIAYSVATISNATGYTWNLPTGAAIATGSNTNSITVNFSLSATSGNMSVYGTNTTCPAGGTPSPIFPVTVNSLPNPTLSGPTSICKGTTGAVYTTESGMTGYQWTVSSGGTITAGGTSSSNTVTVTWNTAGAQTVTVNYNNVNGCSAATPTSKSVTVNAIPVPTMTGNSNVCSGSTGNVYSTESGMTNYVWIVSAGGTITAGGTSSSNTVTVTWNTSGAQTVSVNYTNASNCTAPAALVYNVNVNPLPSPTLSGPSSICSGFPGNIYVTQAGMTNYQWVVSAGGTVTSGGTPTSNTITITWNTQGAQSVSVNYNSGICSAVNPVVYNVTVLESPVPTIGNSSDPCVNTTGNQYFTESGMSGYQWAVSSGGVITTGQGTNAILVTWNNPGVQWVTVNYSNSTGCFAASPTIFNLIVNVFPGAAGSISGDGAVCIGTTGVNYTTPLIANANYYTWTLPVGATISSGTGTNNILVDYAINATSGDVTVAGTNSCGSGTTSSLPVIVTPFPPVPTVIVNGFELTSSAPSGNQWYYNGTAIPGATSQTYTVTHNTGYYWCVVTLNGCSSEVSNKEWIEVVGMGELPLSTSFQVYPVPNDGLFNTAIQYPTETTFTIVIYNQIGSKIFELREVKTLGGKYQNLIDLRPIPNGIYSVVFFNSELKVVRKVMVSK